LAHRKNAVGNTLNIIMYKYTWYAFIATHYVVSLRAVIRVLHDLSVLHVSRD